MIRLAGETEREYQERTRQTSLLGAPLPALYRRHVEKLMRNNQALDKIFRVQKLRRIAADIAWPRKAFEEPKLLTWSVHDGTSVPESETR